MSEIMHVRTANGKPLYFGFEGTYYLSSTTDKDSDYGIKMSTDHLYLLRQAIGDFLETGKTQKFKRNFDDGKGDRNTAVGREGIVNNLGNSLAMDAQDYEWLYNLLSEKIAEWEERLEKISRDMENLRFEREQRRFNELMCGPGPGFPPLPGSGTLDPGWRGGGDGIEGMPPTPPGWGKQ